MYNTEQEMQLFHIRNVYKMPTQKCISMIETDPVVQGFFTPWLKKRPILTP